VSQLALSEHMRILVDAELVSAKRIKQWTFYKRDEPEIRRVKNLLRML
jgi:DNA-binding transcriptional ArsR family regulator